MNKFINFNNLKWTCHHLHIDKSNTISPYLLNESVKHMKNKWFYMRNIKKNYTKDDLKKRMLNTTKNLVSQGCYKIRTFIDIDSIVGLTALKAANEVKQFWRKHNVNLQIGTQLLEGLETQENIDLFDKACYYVDFIGCLPSRDKIPEKHLEIVFDKAKELNLDIEAHLDQLNIPSEKETELFCDFVEKYKFHGRARAIHSISLACHPIDYQHKIAKKLSELNIGVIICPSAAISMTQHNEFIAPIHNSIAPVKILLENNVKIGLGVDNIQDIFVPFCDGNLQFELRLLAEAERIYDINTLINIASNNMGFK
tara:strand:- start:3696 stop:4631 length:936 start_codon:yes stop_codon:yes gene_type:complete